LLPGIPLYENVLYAINAIATAVLAWRVIALGLHRKYRVFTFYLFWGLLQAVIITCSTGSIYRYVAAYAVTECVAMSLILAVVLEVYSVVLRQASGTSRFMSQCLGTAVGIGVAVALALLLLEDKIPRILATTQVLKRAGYSSALFFMLAITMLIFWFPLRVSRNTVTYSIGFAIYLSSESATLLLHNMGILHPRIMSPLNSLVAISCFLYWIVGLRPEAEEPRLEAPEGNSDLLLRRMREMTRWLSSRPPYN